VLSFVCNRASKNFRTFGHEVLLIGSRRLDKAVMIACISAAGRRTYLFEEIQGEIGKVVPFDRKFCIQGVGGVVTKEGLEGF